MIDYLRAILKILFSKKQSRTYYSQFGEDVVLRELMGKRHPKGSYLDIGCYHPKKHSNTYFLYKLGWSGMLIDIEKAKLIACKMIRPRDKTLFMCRFKQQGNCSVLCTKKIFGFNFSY